MKPEVTIAITKAVATKAASEAREALVPGEYVVDALVRVSGTVSVGEDTEKTATGSLLSEAFLVAVLKACGCTRDAAAAAIERTAREYLVDWTGSAADKKAAKKAREALVAEYDPDGSITAIFDGVKASVPKTPVRGAVKFAGAVEAIEVTPEVVLAAVAEGKVA